MTQFLYSVTSVTYEATCIANKTKEDADLNLLLSTVTVCTILHSQHWIC